MDTTELLLIALLNPLTIVVASWGTAKLTGWLVGRRLGNVWQHAAATMPGLPPRAQKDGEAGQRFDDTVAGAIGDVLAVVKASPTGIDAATVATRTGTPPEIAAAALEAIADRAEHHLRVTRAGRILYDFDPDALARAKSLLKRPFFGKIARVFVLALANVGTGWPLISTLGVAAIAAYTGLQHGLIVWLCIGLAAIAALAVATFVLSMFAGWLAAPADQPKFAGPLGDPDGPPDEGNFVTRALEKFSDSPSGGTKRRRSSSGGWSAGDIGDAIFGGLRNIRDIRFILAAVVVVVFVATVGAIFATLISWLVGLWRSVNDRAVSLSDISPGMWVRSGQRPSGLSSIAPTTDVAGRAVRAVSLALSGTRPGDRELRLRVHALAARDHGKVAALNIALREGLDLEEAIGIGTRIAVEAGGSVDVSEAGDVVFAFTPIATAGVDPYPDYELLNPNDQLRPLTDGVPLNVPGLTDQHLSALDRLAGGALLMVMSSPVIAAGIHAEWDVPLVWLVLPATLLLPVAMSTVALAAAARTAATHAARLGVLRDVRRATMTALSKAVSLRKSALRASQVGANAVAGVRKLWPHVHESIVLDEVVRALEQVAARPRQRVRLLGLR